MSILSSVISRRGETMIEVIIALLLVAVGALSALKMITVAVAGTSDTKDQIVAVNMAREGIEAVRNIRDTNWLRFGGERRQCWNNNNPMQCDGLDLVEPKETYIVERAGNHRMQLVDVTNPLNIADGLDAAYALYEGADGMLFQSDTAPGALGTATRFYRSVGIEYLNDTGTDTYVGTQTEANVMRVTSRVEWASRGKIRNVTLSAVITDYLGRSTHD